MSHNFARKSTLQHSSLVDLGRRMSGQLSSSVTSAPQKVTSQPAEWTLVLPLRGRLEACR